MLSAAEAHGDDATLERSSAAVRVRHGNELGEGEGVGVRVRVRIRVRVRVIVRVSN